MKKYILFAALLQLLVPGVPADDASAPANAGPFGAILREMTEIGAIADQKNIAIEVDSIKAAVMNALIKAMDPMAAILTAEEAERILEEKRGDDGPDATGLMEEWPQRIGYIKLNGLYKDSGEQVARQLEIWLDEDYFGVILDLRDAGGTDLDSAAQAAGLFVESGKHLFSVKDGAGSVLAEYRSENDRKMTVPVMILLSRETGGASEVLAAVLKNRQGVLLIGSETGGDDRIRETIPLSDDTILYIATSRVYMDEGRTYRDKGVVPDIIIPDFDEVSVPEALQEDDEEYGIFSGWSEDERDSRALMKRIGNDPALRRAVDLLLGIKALGIRME